jgi:hypothetical protein
MPITEIVLPSHKQDEASIKTFETEIRPLLAATLSAATGIKGLQLGRIISRNGVNIERGINYALGIGTTSSCNAHFQT